MKSAKTLVEKQKAMVGVYRYNKKSTNDAMVWVLINDESPGGIIQEDGTEVDPPRVFALNTLTRRFADYLFVEWEEAEEKKLGRALTETEAKRMRLSMLRRPFEERKKDFLEWWKRNAESIVYSDKMEFSLKAGRVKKKTSEEQK